MNKLEWTTIAIGFILLAAWAFLGPIGCATPGFKAAGCIRYRHAKYNTLVCDDAAVGKHCLFWMLNQGRKRGAPIPRMFPGTNDDGSPVTQEPRGCMMPGKFGRKPNVIVGKSHTGCIDHEVAHIENPTRPKWVAENFPCVEDVRK